MDGSREGTLLQTLAMTRCWDAIPQYALQSFPGFAEVFYRWDSLLGGLFVAGLAGAIQYMHSRFLEPKSGKQKHFEMFFRDWKCGFVIGDPFFEHVLSSINSTLKSLKSWKPRWMGIRTRDPASLWTPGMEAFDTFVNVGLFVVEFARFANLQQKDINHIYLHGGIWYVYHCANKMYFV